MSFVFATFNVWGMPLYSPRLKERSRQWSGVIEENLNALSHSTAAFTLVFIQEAWSFNAALGCCCLACANDAPQRTLGGRVLYATRCFVTGVVCAFVTRLLWFYACLECTAFNMRRRVAPPSLVAVDAAARRHLPLTWPCSSERFVDDGLMMLASVPPIASGIERFPRIAVGDECFASKGVHWAVFELPPNDTAADAPARLLALNTHMCAGSPPNSDLPQVALLSDMIQQLSAQFAPITHALVGGDLNIRRNIEPLPTFMADNGLRELFEVPTTVCKPGQALSNDDQVDHLLFRSAHDYAVEQTHLRATECSDHFFAGVRLAFTAATAAATKTRRRKKT